MNPEWLDVLNKVKNGEIGVEEAAKRLDSLDAVDTEPASSETSTPPPFTDSRAEATAAEVVENPPDLGRWKEFWLIPFWVGTGIFVLGAMIMGWAYSAAQGPNFWFYCSWLPLTLGLIVLFVAWWSRRARWVHVRVNSSDGNRVNISMPLPLGLTGWVLRVFGPMIPAVQEQKLDFLPDILDAVSQTDEPIMVDVDDEDGDKVKVYII